MISTQISSKISVIRNNSKIRRFNEFLFVICIYYIVVFKIHEEKLFRRGTFRSKYNRFDGVKIRRFFGIRHLRRSRRERWVLAVSREGDLEVPWEEGRERKRVDEMEISSGFISHGKSTGARNDRGITNGAWGGQKKGGTGCQRNNGDAKGNKMPSGVAPINHAAYVPFSVFVVTWHAARFAPRRSIR